MGGEYGPLGRRHSGKGRAVPVRRPSIVRCWSRRVPVVVSAYVQLAAAAQCAVLVTALCAGVAFVQAQQLPSIESLTESYMACVQSAFVRRLDDFAVNGNLPQATERSFLDCQLEEDALYTTAVASAPGNTQALALVRAAVEQLKAKLKADLLMPAPPMH
jgi:hypothetical protein